MTPPARRLLASAGRGGALFRRACLRAGVKAASAAPPADPAMDEWLSSLDDREQAGVAGLGRDLLALAGPLPSGAALEARLSAALGAPVPALGAMLADASPAAARRFRGRLPPSRGVSRA